MCSTKPESKKVLPRPDWGLLPEDIIKSLNQRLWNNSQKVKKLLKGESHFPYEVSLKAPRGNAVLADVNHFQKFVSSWKRFNEIQIACNVSWEKRSFRSLSEQFIPTTLSIPDVAALARLLGKNQEQQLAQWQSKIAYILNAFAPLFVDSHSNKKTEVSDKNSKERMLFLALIDHLEALNKFDYSDLDLLVKLIPQLKQGMGGGCYLRALPVTFADTKFIENNLRIIEVMTVALIDEDVREKGLLNWLDCKDKPKDWLLIKPLCEQAIAALGGIPLLRLSSDTLLEFELPASNILIIENEQSCLTLNNIPDTIAISGGGKNLTWMRARWLTVKRVGYWGDIDSEGLSILSDARSKLSSITPLMMDATTVEAYQERMVAEPDSVFKEPIALTEEELALFKGLRSEQFANMRLEQERLPMDYVTKVIQSWIE
ncbi:MAG TPA: DUF3322 and DUF2220 domain-containing protein [Chromatiales bacterium]|nr:DUF3322 and DUF2220 domain-containing protein [Chromatiales bacterium]